MTLVDELLFGLGCVLVAIAGTVGLLCRLSNDFTGANDPVEQFLTLLFTGVPGALGIVLIATAII